MALPRKDAKGERESVCETESEREREREREGRFRSNNESFQSDEIEFEIAAKVELSRKKDFHFSQNKKKQIA